MNITRKLIAGALVNATALGANGDCQLARVASFRFRKRLSDDQSTYHA